MAFIRQILNVTHSIIPKCNLNHSMFLSLLLEPMQWVFSQLWIGWIVTRILTEHCCLSCSCQTTGQCWIWGKEFSSVYCLSFSIVGQISCQDGRILTDLYDILLGFESSTIFYWLKTKHPAMSHLGKWGNTTLYLENRMCEGVKN